jgi:SAM-dependent methyltransferase
MRLQWLQNQTPARCPICGEEGPKGAVLSTDHVLPGYAPVTLLRCPVCGAAFLQDLTPPDYENGMAELLDYYVEQGAGIDLIVAPLLRLPPRTVRRYLEVGCSFGFALDFSRHAFGWEVLGVDPSPLAAAGGEALGVPLRRAYFSAGLDLGPEPFDLALCSEVLEHLAEPHGLLAALRERLSPDGLLILSTPNLDLVRRETEEGALGRALSPGLHMVLYDRGALVRVLESAGFSAVRVEESPETLHAFAARSPAALERLLPAAPAEARSLLRDYFAARAESAPPASALACGFAYRHFKECVNAGLYEEAPASRARLARVYRQRYGLDLETPATVAAVLREPQGERAYPFNLTGALFFSGILELNSLGRPDQAAECFAAAAIAGATLQEAQCPFGLNDGETEALLRQSRKHLPMALAAVDPGRAAGEIEALERAVAADSRFLPPALLAEARAQTFVRLVNAGAYEAAERLAPQVARQVDALALEERGAEALDCQYCLGILALHGKRPGREESQPLPPLLPRIIIAERFVSPLAKLSGVVLPLDVIARRPAARLRFVILAGGSGSLPASRCAWNSSRSTPRRAPRSSSASSIFPSRPRHRSPPI